MTAAGSEERISARRKWLAVGVATLLLAGSFWLIWYGLWLWLVDVAAEVGAGAGVEAGAEMRFTAGAGFALGGGFALMFAGFAALALISRRARPWRGAAVAWLLGASVGLLLAMIIVEPFTPMVAGFGAGGLTALRAEPEHSLGRRAVAVALVAIYIYLFVRFATLPAVIVGPLLPLPVLVWVDASAERRAAQAAEQASAGSPKRPLRASRSGRE